MWATLIIQRKQNIDLKTCSSLCIPTHSTGVQFILEPSHNRGIVFHNSPHTNVSLFREGRKHCSIPYEYASWWHHKTDWIWLCGNVILVMSSKSKFFCVKGNVSCIHWDMVSWYCHIAKPDWLGSSWFHAIMMPSQSPLNWDHLRKKLLIFK